MKVVHPQAQMAIVRQHQSTGKIRGVGTRYKMRQVSGRANGKSTDVKSKGLLYLHRYTDQGVLSNSGKKLRKGSTGQATEFSNINPSVGPRTLPQEAAGSSYGFTQHKSTAMINANSEKVLNSAGERAQTAMVEGQEAKINQQVNGYLNSHQDLVRERYQEFSRKRNVNHSE